MLTKLIILIQLPDLYLHARSSDELSVTVVPVQHWRFRNLFQHFGNRVAIGTIVSGRDDASYLLRGTDVSSMRRTYAARFLAQHTWVSDGVTVAF